MSRRLNAWLMVAVLGLVLPLAGAPLRYCLCTHLLVLANTPSCACDDHGTAAGCCHKQQPKPSKPDCMVALKLLPEALPQASLALPAPVVADLPPPVFAAPEAPVARWAKNHPPHDRGPPPAGPPIYLRDRSLLL